MRTHPSTHLVAASMMLAVLFAACSPNPESPASDPTPSSGGSRSISIPQPPVEGLDVAAEDRRVDLAMPTFSNPTSVTNPLFPASRQGSVLLLGQVDGKPFRTEVTLLPETKIIEWDGQQIEALVSQYTAFLDGRIHEVAYDFYAQADDGSVWYLGEDVYNFADGSIVDTHGTWIAGKEGPGAMIMPADPQVGDTYRPENIPGFVFEEVTVTAVDQTVDGPLGSVDGAIVISELHMDGATEDKTFAPGYGEFYTAGGGDVEALALSADADAAEGPEPAELEAIATATSEVAAAAKAQEWAVAERAVREIAGAWAAYPLAEAPMMVAERMTAETEVLSEAVGARDSEAARQSAITLGQSVLDLGLLYRPTVEVDRSRLDLWMSQLELDAQLGDVGSVHGDAFTLDYIRDRILASMDPQQAQALNEQLESLQNAISEGDLQRTAKLAGSAV